MLTPDILSRLHLKVACLIRGLEQTVLAIAERVDREVQALKLQWQTTSLRNQIERLYQDLGFEVCASLASPHQRLSDLAPPLSQRLADTAAHIRSLKQELMELEPELRQIESEALHEALLALERDLVRRSAALERLRVVQGASASGCLVHELGLPPSVKVAAILRGPALILDAETVRIKPGDTVVLIGLQDALKRVRSLFGEPKRVPA
jgi:regulator of replication initiation timing